MKKNIFFVLACVALLFVACKPATQSPKQPAKEPATHSVKVGSIYEYIAATPHGQASITIEILSDSTARYSINAGTFGTTSADGTYTINKDKLTFVTTDPTSHEKVYGVYTIKADSLEGKYNGTPIVLKKK